MKRSDQFDKSSKVRLTETSRSDIIELAKAGYGTGQLADYIPALRNVEPHQFGLTIVDCDGEVHTCGDSDTRFSIQSISKMFDTLNITILPR